VLYNVNTMFFVFSKEADNLTVIHILNFVIPITCIALIGIALDKMCKLETQKEEGSD